MDNRVCLCSVKDDYIDYLRRVDTTVLKNKDGKRKYIGVLFEIDNQSYYAPLSSPKPKHLKMNSKAPDIVKINDGKLGVINLNNMIPVPKSEIVSFNIENVSDEKYKNLLRDQAKNITSNKKNIIKKARLLYSIYNSGKHPRINARCCNFKLLEVKCSGYLDNVKTEVNTEEKVKEIITKAETEVAATE